MEKFGNKVTVPIKTAYGTINVDFLIIDILNVHDKRYLGYAQKRVAVLQYKADNQWWLIDDVNLCTSLDM